MNLLLSLGLLTVVNAYVSFEDVVKEEFNAFKVQYKKDYKDETEENRRMNIFTRNKLFIAQHNQKYHQGLVSFELGINTFADLSNDEFKKIFNGFKSNRSREVERVTFKSAENDPLPRSVDWREKGAVTPIKNQGECGSCWAFSTTGSLEGQHFLKKKELVSLSEQNLVDCSDSFGNNGCGGGLVDTALLSIKYNGGINKESDYPYKGIDGECKFRKNEVAATVTGLVDIPMGDENKLAEAISSVGPISIAIDASHPSFQFYSSGIYYEKECGSTESELDHAVLVVGYGVDEARGKSFYVVKNSWGTTWGENGYIKMSKNMGNNCGVATEASFPLV